MTFSGVLTTLNSVVSAHGTRIVTSRTGVSTQDAIPPNDRLAGIAFIALAVAGFMMYAVTARRNWFFDDEWAFLSHRSAGNVVELFRPHGEHWSTVPILWYRALYRVVGLRSYVPYQLPVIALHVVAASLLRVIMRSAGVHPWIATGAAALFVFFGAGGEDIVWAFQIGFEGALVLGLTHLALANHDGPLARRDALGLTAGLFGLLFSGVAVTMTIVVAIAMLIRRGYRIALFHSAPLAVVYVAWFAVIGREGYQRTRVPVVTEISFVWTGLSATLGALVQIRYLGPLLAIVLVAGLSLAWLQPDRRGKLATPIAMLIGGLVFISGAAIGRAALFGADFARSGRYLHILAALFVPALAVAVDALVQRGRAIATVAIVVLVIGIPGNIGRAVHWDQDHPFALGSKDLILTYPRVPLARAVPRSTLLPPAFPYQPDIGFLLAGVRSGRLPRPPRNPALLRAATRNLARAAGRG